MESIRVASGGRCLYVEKEKIAAAVMRPQIQIVPESGKEILGILCYEGQLVPFYHIGQGDCGRCGLLMRKEGEQLYGIRVEVEGDINISKENLQEILPGIWEVAGD